MHYLKDTGFVIKRVNFGESDRYLTIFSENNGKMEVIARGVRKLTSRRASSLELLSLISFQTVKSSKNFVLTEVQLIDSFSHRKQDLKQIQKMFFLCELLNVLCPLAQKNQEVFTLVKNALSSRADSFKTSKSFQLEILTHLGFWDRERSAQNLNINAYIEQIIEKKLRSSQFFNA